jgi:type II secretion system protein C
LVTQEVSDLFKRFGKLSELPWRPLVISLGVGFLLASLLTTLLGELILPTFMADLQQAAPDVVVQAPQVKTPITLDPTAIKAIIKRNIFNIDGKTGEEEVDPKDQIPGGAPVKTTLPLQLIGIIYGGRPDAGIVVVKNTAKNTQGSFFAGESLAADAVITEILEDRIILQRTGRREYLELENKTIEIKRRKKDPKDIKAGLVTVKKAGDGVPASYKEEGFEREGTKILMSTDYRQKLLTTDFAKVLQDVKAEPNLVGKELNGFRLTRIRADSVYQKAGLLDGDIIKEINGVSLIDPGQAIKLLNNLRGESEIELRLERNGSPLTLSMKVK